MASGLYKPTIDAQFKAAPINWSTADIRAVLIDTADYTVDLTNHNFLDDVASGARVGTPVALSSKTFTAGVFDAADTTLTSVTGDACEALILFVHTGTDSTAQLLAYIDGFTVTPNGNDITITWDTNIFTVG